VTQNPGASIVAGAGSFVHFSGLTLVNGTFATSGTGIGQVVGSSTFTGVANEGVLTVEDARLLAIVDGITNNGAMTVNPTAGGNGTYIQFNNSGAIAGDGEIVLNASGNVDTASVITVGAAVATNTGDHLIRGTGNIAAVLINDGEIRADQSGKILRLNGGPKTNNSLFSAVNGGVLQLSSLTVTQDPAASILATNAEVQFAAITLNGGSIGTAGSGLGRVTGSSTFTSVINNGLLNIDDARLLAISSGLVNNATITVNPTAGGNGTYIQVNNTYELTGTGQVILNASGNLETAAVYTVGGAVLTNAPGHTIAGRGRINGNFINNGRIAPGNPTDSTSYIERAGTYTSTPTSVIDIDINGVIQGDSYDHFRSTGAMTLGGTLTVRLAPGYIPPASTAFTVVSAPSISGIYDTVNLPVLPQALGYARIQYLPNAVRILIPLCTTDWNGMDGINSQDLFDFLTDFFSNNADFNFDGFSNSQDFFDFLVSFFGGCK